MSGPCQQHAAFENFRAQQTSVRVGGFCDMQWLHVDSSEGDLQTALLQSCMMLMVLQPQCSRR